VLGSIELGPSSGHAPTYLCPLQLRVLAPPPPLPSDDDAAASFLDVHALGSTVEELGIKDLPKELNPLGGPKAKTLFSMMIPEVVEGLSKEKVESVVIFGIEVSP